nr:hypothetical protein CFP56_09892 [Quercus suber]
MAEAHYFHATLYRFVTPEARAEVVTRFNAAIADVTARCWYDVEAHGFEADECLGEIIDQYVEEELQAAMHEERPASVEWFANVFADSLPPDPDNADASEPIEGPAPPSSSRLPLKVATVFIIDTEGVPSTHVRFLQSKHMPKEVVRRILVDPLNQKLVRAISRGHRACAVRLIVGKQQHIYNGRIARRAYDAAAVDDDWLRAVNIWPRLQSARGDAPGQPTGDVQPSKDEQSRRWNLKGKQPTVSQWLADIGEGEPSGRVEEADLPQDAKLMLANSLKSYDTAPLGNILIPEGVALLPSPEEEEEPERDSDDDSITFSELLRGLGPCRRSSQVSQSQTQGLAAEKRNNGGKSHIQAGSAQQASSGAPMKRQGLGPDQRKSGPVHWEPVTDQHATVTGSGDVFTENGTELTQNMTPSVVTDKLGIRGNAAIQARWQLDRAVLHQQRKASRPTVPSSGLRFRDPSHNLAHEPTRREPTEVTRATATGDSSDSSSEKCSDFMTWDDVLDSQADPASGDVLDTSDGPQNVSVKPPPELSSLPNSGERAVPVSKDVQRLRNELTKTAPRVDQNSPLIDLSEDGSVSPLPRKFELLSFHSPPLVPSRRQAPAAPATSAGIRERLAEQSEEPPVKYTMRQQAGGKGKSKVQPQGSRPNVQLPLPDWKSSPQKRRDQEGDKVKPVASRSTHDDGLTSASDEPEHFNLIVLEHFLRDTKLMLGDKTFDIVVHFGRVYLEFPDEIPQNMDTADLAKKISSAAQQPPVAFLSRLTQSDADAIHMLGLGSDPSGARSAPSFFYDVHVRSTEGQVHVLRYRHEPKRPTAGTDLPSNSGSEVVSVADAYMLFPYRPFDAHVAAETHACENDSMLADFTAFMASARSSANLTSQGSNDPSFEAHVSVGLRIEKIHARTCFRTPFLTHATLEVVYVRELEVRPMPENIDGYNLRASLHDADDDEDVHPQWWEVQLRMDPAADVEHLVDAAESLVREIDAVGLGNHQGGLEIETQELAGSEKKSQPALKSLW